MKFQVKITKIKFGLKFISKLFIILVVLLLGHYIFQFFDSIYVCAFFVQNLGEEPKPKSTYAEYVRTYYKVYIGIVPEAFSRENFQHLREICEKMPQKCNSWYGQLTLFRYCIYTYKYQQHLDDTKEVSTGIFKKKVLYRFFLKKFFIIVETNGKCMGFKAEIESGHLSSF